MRCRNIFVNKWVSLFYNHQFCVRKSIDSNIWVAKCIVRVLLFKSRFISVFAGLPNYIPLRKTEPNEISFFCAPDISFRSSSVKWTTTTATSKNHINKWWSPQKPKRFLTRRIIKNNFFLTIPFHTKFLFLVEFTFLIRMKLKADLETLLISKLID